LGRLGDSALGWAHGRSVRGSDFTCSVSHRCRFAGAAVAYGAIEQTVTDKAGELGDLVISCARELGVDLTFVHTRGDAATEILGTAGSSHADLVVVGRSTKARHHVAGSLGRRLVGRRNAPVIVVVP
jgi:nucleotide-binding universal stress UspA family protein